MCESDKASGQARDAAVSDLILRKVDLRMRISARVHREELSNLGEDIARIHAQRLAKLDEAALRLNADERDLLDRHVA